MTPTGSASTSAAGGVTGLPADAGDAGAIWA